MLLIAVCWVDANGKTIFVVPRGSGIGCPGLPKAAGDFIIYWQQFCFIIAVGITAMLLTYILHIVSHLKRL